MPPNSGGSSGPGQADPTSAVAEQVECQLQSIIDHALDEGVQIYCETVTPYGHRASGYLEYEPLADAVRGALGHRTVNFFRPRGR
jgi:hypothetical protein